MHQRCAFLAASASIIVARSAASRVLAVHCSPITPANQQPLRKAAVGRLADSNPRNKPQQLPNTYREQGIMMHSIPSHIQHAAASVGCNLGDTRYNPHSSCTTQNAKQRDQLTKTHHRSCTAYAEP